MIAWLRRIGTGVYIAGAVILAVAVACLRMFFLGRSSERDDQEVGYAKDEAAKVKEAVKRGDADAILDSFRRSTTKRSK